MKKALIIIASLASLFFVADSCKKTGGEINPLSSVKNLGVGAYLVLDSTINVNFDNTALATSTVGITVSYYPNGEPVEQILLYVASGSTYDTTKWHYIKTVPYSGSGTVLTATGSDLATALGVDINSFTPGTYYTFYTRIITKSGKTYDVNNTGNNAGSGLVTGPTYYSAFLFTCYITCPFTGGMKGDYTVMVDDWADWAAGATVHVTDGPGSNQINLSGVYPGGGIIKDSLVVNVNAANGVASIPLVDIGSYSVGGTQYYAEGANASDIAGYVFSCTGYITLTIEFTANGNSYGSYRLILQKQ